ncbi:MAG: sugar-transfer associated ATP-grasp domain-containing protein, partial [Halofilum sp. (in: g-proteobacteria)]
MLNRLRLPIRRIRATARAWPEIAGLARWADHRLTPVARKPRYRRLLDLAYISLRWGEVSSAYYGQGVDGVGHTVRRDFMPYPAFRRIRDSRNRSSGTSKPYDYICLLQDKRLFERYFALGGLPVVPTVCELRPEGVELDGGNPCTFTELAGALGPARTLFCKPRHGIHAHDAFCLDTSQDGLLVDDEPTSPQSLAKRIQGPYLCQERIIQHAALARPHPGSVNTVRIVTVITERSPEVLFASLKIGADGAITDNGGTTRVIARAHPETGR